MMNTSKRDSRGHLYMNEEELAVLIRERTADRILTPLCTSMNEGKIRASPEKLHIR